MLASTHTASCHLQGEQRNACILYTLVCIDPTFLLILLLLVLCSASLTVLFYCCLQISVCKIWLSPASSQSHSCHVVLSSFVPSHLNVRVFVPKHHPQRSIILIPKGSVLNPPQPVFLSFSLFSSVACLPWLSCFVWTAPYFSCSFATLNAHRGVMQAVQSVWRVIPKSLFKSLRRLDFMSPHSLLFSHLVS